nr:MULTISPECIES: FkbM family methyltransferase [Paenibacillus]
MIDGGAYDGDTAEQFATYCQTIYSFEPSTAVYESLVQNIKKNCLEYKVKPSKVGLWSENGEADFSTIIDQGLHLIIDDGNETIPVTSIDSFVESSGITKVDFIKLDIEGAEYNAILGGRKTILNHSPILSICLYHQSKHLWEIPEYIHTLNPSYKLFIGHHSNQPYETIMYATV